VRPAAIHIENGTIVHVGPYDEVAAGAEILDAGDFVVSPGIVDTHVHVNEPGRTEWEGFDTATRAAAAGGVTTIVDMPLNSVPATTSVEGLRAKRDAAIGRCHVDVGFWGGVVPGNAEALDALVDRGVRGFKCFLVPSGVDEFPAVDEGDLRQALPVLARRNVPLLVHAESPRVIDDAARDVARVFPLGGPRGRQGRDDRGDDRGPEMAALQGSYATYLATRPPAAEVDAIRLMIRLAAEFRVRTHIVHVAAAEAVEAIAHARAGGVPITAETCPHYLTFTADEVPDGATVFKCAPPIREAPHRAALWDGLRRGVLDLVATDHSPAPPALKCTGDFLRAWGGIASLELSPAAVWTAARCRGRESALEAEVLERAGGGAPASGVRNAVTPLDLARWMSAAPAALAGLADRKGAIAVGRDADLIVWDTDAAFTVDASRLQQRHKLTPYAGRTLRGVVHATFVRGEQIWRDDCVARAGCGRLLYVS
jgi:allantoinase